MVAETVMVYGKWNVQPTSHSKSAGIWAKACEKVVWVVFLCESHLQSWCEIIFQASNWTQFESSLEPQCSPIITVDFFTIMWSDISMTIESIQWPWQCQEDGGSSIILSHMCSQHSTIPWGLSDTHEIFIPKQSNLISDDIFLITWNFLFKAPYSVYCQFFIFLWDFIHMGQTTHRASGGAISEVGNRKSDNSPKNNWGQLAFAKLPVDVLVFRSWPKHFQTHYSTTWLEIQLLLNPPAVLGSVRLCSASVYLIILLFCFGSLSDGGNCFVNANENGDVYRICGKWDYLVAFAARLLWAGQIPDLTNIVRLWQHE